MKVYCAICRAGPLHFWRSALYVRNTGWCCLCCGSEQYRLEREELRHWQRMALAY